MIAPSLPIASPPAPHSARVAARDASDAARDASDAASDGRLRDAALRLEAGFLKEMLSVAGLGRATQGLGGGAGEAQFASFLLEEQAQGLARAGGLGLAESLFEALRARDAG